MFGTEAWCRRDCECCDDVRPGAALGHISVFESCAKRGTIYNKVWEEAVLRKKEGRGEDSEKK